MRRQRRGNGTDRSEVIRAVYKTRAKMPSAHRAKQFMPFSAVKGLQEALSEKERPYQTKNEIAEDAADSLNLALMELMPGMRADIAYYTGGEYRTQTGDILSIDGIRQRLLLGDTEIFFDDIISIETVCD